MNKEIVKLVKSLGWDYDRFSTSGKETYGGGRFLEVAANADEVIVLDFNLAYNPYCVYNPGYICAVPPLSNKLDIRIFAGEKKPSFLYH